MNSCDSCLENLSAYLDKELSEADVQAFEQHIQTCEACAEELAVMKAILSSCGELEEELPAGFEASLHKRLEAAKEEAAAKKNQLVKIRLFSQIAAGFVLVIALGLVVRSGLFTRKAAGDAAAQSPMMMSAKNAAGGNADNQTAAASDTANDAGGTEVEQADLQEGTKMMTAAMRSTTAPERPEPTADSPASKSEEKVVMVEDTSIVSLTFSEQVIGRLEGYDTLVRIQAADMNKALDSILAIEKKLDNGTDANCVNLDDAKQKFYGAAGDQPVEVKLYYSNDELWQKFLDEMQGVFPDMVVESVSAQEEQEYIRVVLQKAE